MLISINWRSLVTSLVVVQKIYLKIYLVSCTNTHRDATYSINHGVVKNTKTWISSERSRIFLRNEKILDLCLRRHILRSYYFVAEVTFETNIFQEQWLQLNLEFSLGAGRRGLYWRGEGIFLGRGREWANFWLVGGHITDIQDMSDLTKIYSKTTFLKKSCYKEVI